MRVNILGRPPMLIKQKPGMDVDMDVAMGRDMDVDISIVLVILPS